VNKVKWTSAQRKRMASVLMEDHESVDDAVTAILDLFLDYARERMSFVVVGQLYASREQPRIAPTEPAAIKVALGCYSTEGDAKSAAESLWSSSMTGDCFQTWVLPLFHGSPAELHTAQKEKYKVAAQRAKEARGERLRRDIEKRKEEAQQRADEYRKGAA
jgi:hypothetical protein